MSLAKLHRISPESLAGNPRATYAAWLRFAPQVRAAMAVHPQTHIIRVISMSPATFVSRVRDAVRGAIAYGHSDIPVADLAKWFGEVVIRHDVKDVFIGPKEHKLTDIAVNTIPKTEYSFVSLTTMEYHCFMTLLNNGRIAGPIHIEKPDPRWVDPGHPNVSFVPRPDGSLILL